MMLKFCYMKKSLLLFLSILAINLSAQITISPNPVDQVVEMDLSDTYAETVSHTFITNNSTETIGLRWEQKSLSSPSLLDWTSAVCDNNKCYTFGGFTNNSVTGSPADTLWIAPDSVSILDLHLRPGGVAGTGVIRVQLFEIDDLEGNNPLESVIFNFDISAQIVSVSEIERNSIRIFPNPTQSYFELKNAKSIKKINLYNIIGRKVSQFDVVDNKQYFVGDLPMGIYLLQMRDDENNIVKTVRLVKKNP